MSPRTKILTALVLSGVVAAGCASEEPEPGDPGDTEVPADEDVDNGVDTNIDNEAPEDLNIGEEGEEDTEEQ